MHGPMVGLLDLSSLHAVHPRCWTRTLITAQPVPRSSASGFSLLCTLKGGFVKEFKRQQLLERHDRLAWCGGPNAS